MDEVIKNARGADGAADYTAKFRGDVEEDMNEKSVSSRKERSQCVTSISAAAKRGQASASFGSPNPAK